MIVRERESSDMSLYFGLVSISEKRQKQVAEIMGDRLRVRFRTEDDEGVKLGGGVNQTGKDEEDSKQEEDKSQEGWSEQLCDD